MKSALPKPHPARKPTICPMVSEAPASALNATTKASPSSRVRLAPMRLETNPVASIASPVTAM